jgi:transposase
MVWGGISKQGRTGLVVFNGIMKSTFYANKIVSENFCPFVDTHYPNAHRLMQDNDPKHTSRETQRFMLEHNVNWWRTPPESPDLNPIENLWREMKHYIATQVRPKNKAELVAGLGAFWGTVTPQKCTRYINHLYNVMPKVIVNRGASSG